MIALAIFVFYCDVGWSVPKVPPNTVNQQLPRAGSGVVRIDPLCFLLYKATKPGLVLFYILACFNCIVAY